MICGRFLYRFGIPPPTAGVRSEINWALDPERPLPKTILCESRLKAKVIAIRIRNESAQNLRTQVEVADPKALQ
jgi:hypothetical protein